MDKNTGTSEEDKPFSEHTYKEEVFTVEKPHEYTANSSYTESAHTVPAVESDKTPRRSLLQKIRSPFNRAKAPHVSGTSSKPLRIFVKYWYVFLLLLVIIGSLIAWRAYEVANDAKWAKAADYYGRADYKNAAQQLEGLSAPNNDEKRLTMYAQTMLATRQLDKALPAYTDLYAVKKDPAMKIIIGNIYNEQKKYDEAAKVYREVVSSNESYVQAYVNLATLYKLQNKSQDAIDVAKQGVKANPNSVVLNELLVSMLLEDKQSPDYKNAIETLKKINPQDPIFDAIKE